MITVNKQANKSDMVRFVSKKVGVPQNKCSQLIDATLQFISDSLCKKQSVVLWGIGTLKPKIRDAQEYYNISTGKKEMGSPKRIIGYTMSGTLKSKLQEIAPINESEMKMLEKERSQKQINKS